MQTCLRLSNLHSTFMNKDFLLIFSWFGGIKSSALKIDPKFWNPPGAGGVKELELYFKSFALRE